MKRHVWIAMSLMLTMGCQLASPVATRPASKSSATAKRPGVEATLAQRVVDTHAPVVELTGSVKLVSDNGLGLISNNGLGIISNNSGGLISNNGGGLTGGTSRYGVLADKGPGEVLLADALLQVFDASGQVLVDAARRPVSTTSDKKGSYHFKAALPDENLVIRIKLFNGGTLQAILTRADGTGARQLDINTASTLGTVYVLKQYVKGSKDVFARLPGTEVAKLQTAMEAATATLAKAPSYQDDALVATTETLRTQSKPLDSQLDHIKQLLLVGQANLGAGLAANAVPLLNPVAVHRDAAGNTYIAESLGRVRKVDPAGKIALYASPSDKAGMVKGHLDLIADMVGKPDGTLYVAEYAAGTVKRISPDGQVTVVAGGGTGTTGSGAATQQKLGRPHRLALGPDGSLYIGESVTTPVLGRVMKMTPDGQLTMLPAVTGKDGVAEIAGLGIAPDGTVYALIQRGSDGAATFGIDRLKPGATAWEPFSVPLSLTSEEHMAMGADGQLYFGNCLEGKISRTALDAFRPVAVAGGGAAAFTDGQDKLAGQFTIPRGFWLGADGGMLVPNGGIATVTEISSAGKARRFAGLEGLSQVGDGLNVALNNPLGIAADAAGDLIFCEGRGLLKRLRGQAIDLVATDDGTGALAGAGKLGSPTSLCVFQGAVYYVDSAHHVVRKRAADGTITNLAGTGAYGTVRQQSVPADKATFGKLAGIAVDSKGVVWFSDVQHHQVFRIKDGQVELMAGALGADGSNLGTPGDKGDGGPAAQALLNAPSGMAFDENDNLYICDSGNLRIRRIKPDGTIEAYAGIKRDAALGRLLGAQVDMGDVKAADALLVGPGALCFSASGDLYVSELGSVTIKLAGGITGNSTAMGFPLPDIPARLRKVAPDGTVSIVAGPGGKTLTDPADDAALYSPVAMAIDGQGRMAIVDTAANQIKILAAGSF